MQDAASNPTLCDSSLPPHALSSLNHLNLRFLSWLSARAKQPGSARDLHLPLELQHRFANLTHDESAALALCPYALFDLRFDDEAHWKSCLQFGAPAQIADAPAIDYLTRDFVQLAVFYSWHLAVSNPLCLQFVLGMRERLVKHFSETSIDRLPLVAALHSQRLQPRWLHSLRYWRDLMTNASKPQSGEFRRAQLFGIQLSAAARLSN